MAQYYRSQVVLALSNDSSSSLTNLRCSISARFFTWVMSWRFTGRGKLAGFLFRIDFSVRSGILWDVGIRSGVNPFMIRCEPFEWTSPVCLDSMAEMSGVRVRSVFIVFSSRVWTNDIAYREIASNSHWHLRPVTYERCPDFGTWMRVVFLYFSEGTLFIISQAVRYSPIFARVFLYLRAGDGPSNFFPFMFGPPASLLISVTPCYTHPFWVFQCSVFVSPSPEGLVSSIVISGYCKLSGRFLSSDQNGGRSIFYY